jgi:predicted PurR-regulated permease PerM
MGAGTPRRSAVGAIASARVAPDPVTGAPMTTNDGRTRGTQSAAEWAALSDRLRQVTPQAIGRGALTLAVVAGALAMIGATWPAFLPFVVGAILAYQLLPVVDVLDRVMPRVVAALLAVTTSVVAVIAIAVLVIPPIAIALVRLAVDLPTQADVNAALDRLRDQVGGLPDGTLRVVVPVLGALATTVRDAVAAASGSLDDIVRGAIGALLRAVGALLGLIVLPTWMLTIMSQKRSARSAIDARLTPGVRADFWAVIGMADRAAGAYLRGYVVTAIVVGILVDVGANLSPRLGGPTFGEPLALAAFAGASQVVPIIGPILGFVPAVLLLPVDPDRAVAYTAIYLAARVLGGTALGSRLMGRRLGVHSAILVPAVVMIGQLGILWLLLSAPIVSFATDLVRYVHGRLSEPAVPAGVLPRTAEREALGRQRGAVEAATAAAAAGPARVPSAYRRPVAPAPLRTRGESA